MKKVDIEFVAFAANDVITTSGGPAGFYALKANNEGEIPATLFTGSNEPIDLGFATYYGGLFDSSDLVPDKTYVVAGYEIAGAYVKFTYVDQDTFLSKNGSWAGTVSDNLYKSGDETTTSAEVFAWLTQYLGQIQY